MIRYTRRIKRASSQGSKRLYLNKRGIKNLKRSSLLKKGISTRKYKKNYSKNIIRADRIDYSDWKLNKK